MNARGPSRPLPALGDALDFLRLVWAVDHGLQRASRQMEVSQGVTLSQRLVLRIVGRFPQISSGHVARLLHVHPGTLTGIVKRLEAQGLVRRRPDPRDARRSLLGLTERGRAQDVAEAPAESAISQMLATASAADLTGARVVLEMLVAQLEAIDPDASRDVGGAVTDS